MLTTQVEAGCFRSDLFYRLGEFIIYVDEPTKCREPMEALHAHSVRQPRYPDIVWDRRLCVTAVAQKSPCEEKRVIMGQEFPLKLGQRGQDAREEVPMRTPKRLYAHERIIYQPELLTCPHCGDLLVMCNYLAWDKTVQLLDRVLSVASRPG